jgi:hypothetical protein
MKLSASRTTELFEILTLVQTHKMRKRVPSGMWLELTMA